MNYSQYSLEGYKILVSGLGKNLKNILRSMYICLKEKWKKKSGVTPGGSGNPLKTRVLAIFRGLPDPLGVTLEFFFFIFPTDICTGTSKLFSIFLQVHSLKFYSVLKNIDCNSLKALYSKTLTANRHI